MARHNETFEVDTNPRPRYEQIPIFTPSRTGLLFFIGLHGRLEAADALADSFAQFRQLLGSEHEQGNSKNNQQMHRLKQSFKHKRSLRLSATCKHCRQESDALIDRQLLIGELIANARACNRAAALHGSRFSSVCSAPAVHLQAEN